MQKLIENIPEIVFGCINNDRKSQELLYRSFYSYAMHVCLPYVQCKEDADDVLSDAFIRIFKYIVRYDASKGSMYAWIRKIVINTALDHLHSRKQMIFQRSVEEAEEPAIDNQFLVENSAEEILRLIRNLSPATRTVFNLYVLESLNHREIASILNISEGTSKWHLSEAKKQLRKLMGSDPV